MKNNPAYQIFENAIFDEAPQIAIFAGANFNLRRDLRAKALRNGGLTC